MKRFLLIFLFCLTLFTSSSFSQSKGEKSLGLFLYFIIVSPYYLFALLPYIVQAKNRGRSVFFSVMTYILCIGGIVSANNKIYGMRMPTFDPRDDNGLFLFMILPFLVIIFMAASKDYDYRKSKDEEDF